MAAADRPRGAGVERSVRAGGSWGLHARFARWFGDEASIRMRRLLE